MNPIDVNTASPQLILDRLDLNDKEDMLAKKERLAIHSKKTSKSDLIKIYKLAIYEGVPISRAREYLSESIGSRITKNYLLEKADTIPEERQPQPKVDAPLSPIRSILGQLNNPNSIEAYWEQEIISNGITSSEQLTHIYQRGEQLNLSVNQCREALSLCRTRPWLVDLLGSTAGSTATNDITNNEYESEVIQFSRR